MAIITISRKVGSWGDDIAARLADDLGYKLVTREEIHRLAQDCDDDVKKACALFESELPKGFRERFLFKDPSYTSLFKSLNYELAAAGDVVILGRGAQVVLAGKPGVLRVRVVAPAEVREKRIMERHHIDQAEAADYLRRYDHHRRSLIESIFHCSVSDWSLYDLVINTVGFDQERAAALIETAVRDWPQPADWSACEVEFRNLAMAANVESHVLKKVPVSPGHELWVEMPVKGKVVLNGFVQDKRTKELAGKVASDHEGITEVDNQLRTTELSF